MSEKKAKEPSLKKKLHQETLEGKAPCREHHFGDWGRCRYCSMQTRYYYESIAMLNSWSKKEKQTKKWKHLADNLQCKPHFHEEDKSNE